MESKDILVWEYELSYLLLKLYSVKLIKWNLNVNSSLYWMIKKTSHEKYNGSNL